MSRSFLLVAVLAAAGVACAPPLTPLVAPTPAPVSLAPPGAAAGPTAAAPDAGSPSAGSPSAVGQTRSTPGDSVPARDLVTPRELDSELVRVFGDSAAPAPMSAADSDEAPGAPVWDIDVRSYETHARVEAYVAIFGGRARERFAVALKRQTRYGAMIRERLRAGGLPEDMTYLALIESWYDPHAYSRAAAVGMWQFMAGTARATGLRVDWWVDERRDPIRSTEGAVAHLNDLRAEFNGSLYLAAAAYNGGSGRVSRGLARNAGALEDTEGDDCFFALAETGSLRPETKDYVPKLIAAALVGKEPARYGIVVESLPPYGYDSVRVGAATPLASVADAAGVPLAEVKELNPMLLRGITPPGGAGWWVRLPVGTGEGFEDRFAALEPEERDGLRRVVTRKGDTPAKLAATTGVLVRQLGWYNRSLKRLKSGALSAGQVVLVPTRRAVAGAMDIPDPSIERYGPSPKRGARTHVVRRGESLGSIAARYGVSVATLKRLNGITGSRVASGRRLVVSGGAAKRPAAKKPAASAKKPAAKKPAAKKPAAKKPAAKKPAAKKPAAKPTR